jgi:predicted GNAT superfamily acetyltransferase
VGEIEIREVRGLDDYRRCVDIQLEVWGLPELEVTPVIELLTVHRYGGVCIGAFDREDMVGFVYGMAGCREGRFFHHSHMLAVLPEHRGRGIGERLKWAQRERVLSQGLDRIDWTFDPLQAPNAYLNIERLGVVIHRYTENVYGESCALLHGGIPTDRFEADWCLESGRVCQRREGKIPARAGWEDLPHVNRTGPEGGFIRCKDFDLDQDDRELLVEIPPDITTMIAQDNELALDWRMKTRRIFQTYFDRGYTVAGFHRSEDRVFYRLSHQLTTRLRHLSAEALA